MSTLKSNLSKLFLYKGQGKYLFVIFLCLIMSSYIGVQIPIVISTLFSKINDQNFLSYLVFPALLFFMEYLNRVVYQATVNKFIQRVMARVRDLTYGSFLDSYSVVREDKDTSKGMEITQGEVLARVMNDTEAIRELISSGSFSIIIDSVFIISTLFSFIKIHAQLGQILIFSEILAVSGLVYGGKWMAKMFLLARKANGKMSRVVANLCGGFVQLYYTPHHNYARKRGNIVFDEFLKIQLKANVWDAGYYSLAESLFPLLLTLLVIVAPWVEIKEFVTLALMIDLIQRSIGPIKSVTGKVSSLGRAYSGIKRVDEFIQEMNQFVPSSEIQEVNRGDYLLKDFEINIPKFYYPKKGNDDNRTFHLKDIKVSGKVGDLIGIVGPSGHGKSTVLKILAFELIPSNFSLKLMDEKESKTLNSSCSESDIIKYKQLISLVTQDSHIFSENLFFNITLKKKTDEKDQKFDHFWQIVMDGLPYLKEFNFSPEMMIEPKLLSLGQKQLISALRALFHQRPIVLFDEVSSGLDSFLEESLRKLVLLLQKKSLTIIVSHRIETLVNANEILVIKDGMIESKGTHKELLEQSETYQEFAKELS